MAHRHQARTTALALALGAMTAGAAAQGLGGLDAPFRPRAAPPPLRPAASESEGEFAPGLRVMVTGRQRAVASIDGRLVHVGDEVNGMRVVRIDAQGVVLDSDEGARERLTLTPAAQKRPVATSAGARGVKR